MTLARNPRLKRPRELLPEVLGLCKWCGGKAEPPRRYWCSDGCVREYQSFEPAILRRRCWERDRGFCRACHRDIGELERRLRVLSDLYWKRGGRTWGGKEDPAAWQRGIRWMKLLRRLKVDHRHLWEADHRIPVVEGGPNCLANLRTLCLPCHRLETKKLAARRAQARREQRQPSLQLSTGTEG